MINKKAIILIILFSISEFVIAGKIFTSDKHSFTIETVVDGLKNPWSVEFLPNNRILITERPGYLRIFEDGKLLEPVKGLPDIKAKRQGGLLDIALDQDFISNKLLFLSYSAGNLLGIGTEVASARLIGNTIEDLKVIFSASPKSQGGLHFGSRLLLTENSLYITLGDRGEMERAQDIADHAGSLIRINKDGSVPGDNPFIKDPNAKPEI